MAEEDHAGNTLSIFRFRLATWLLLVAVALSLTLSNLRGLGGDDVLWKGGGFVALEEHGWPLTYLWRIRPPRESLAVLMRETYSWPFDGEIVYFRVWALILDVCVALTLLACTAFASERFLDWRGISRQFSMRTLFALVTAAALLLSFLLYYNPKMYPGGPWGPFNILLDMPRLLSIGCAAYCAGLTARALLRKMRVLVHKRDTP